MPPSKTPCVLLRGRTLIHPEAKLLNAGRGTSDMPLHRRVNSHWIESFLPSIGIEPPNRTIYHHVEALLAVYAASGNRRSMRPGLSNHHLANQSERVPRQPPRLYTHIYVTRRRAIRGSTLRIPSPIWAAREHPHFARWPGPKVHLTPRSSYIGDLPS